MQIRTLQEPRRDDSPLGPAMLESPQREGLRTALHELEAAETDGRPYAMCTALTRVGRCYRALQALSAAEDTLQQALRWACTTGSTDLQVDLLCELAETACLLAERLAHDEPRGAPCARERARDAVFEAAGLVDRVADTQWEMSAVLRMSDVLNRCGDHDDAATLLARALGVLPGSATND